MSNKLISLESVLKETRRFKGYIDDDMIERLSIAFKRLSPVELPMTAREYIKQQFRMCTTQNDGVKCEGCPLSPSVTGEYCDTYEVLYPEQAVAIVEKWAQEHPERSGECRE